MDRILNLEIESWDDERQLPARPRTGSGAAIWDELAEFGDSGDDELDDFDENDFDDDFDDDFEEELDEGELEIDEEDDFSGVDFDEDLDEEELTDDFDEDEDGAGKTLPADGNEEDEFEEE